jgi:hypothetical protein
MERLFNGTQHASAGQDCMELSILVLESCERVSILFRLLSLLSDLSPWYRNVFPLFCRKELSICSKTG